MDGTTWYSYIHKCVKLCAFPLCLHIVPIEAQPLPRNLGQLHINIYIPVCIPVSNRMHPLPPCGPVICVVCNNHLDVIDVTCNNNSYSFIYLTFLYLSIYLSIYLSLYLAVYLSVLLKDYGRFIEPSFFLIAKNKGTRVRDQLFACVLCYNLHVLLYCFNCVHIVPIKAQPSPLNHGTDKLGIHIYIMCELCAFPLCLHIVSY